MAANLDLPFLRPEVAILLVQSLVNLTNLLFLDERFIAKELSRAELETMATFGPAYFDYMSSATTADVSP